MKRERKEWSADWDRFEEIAQRWDEMQAKYGIYKMAALIAKTEAYKAYDMRYPFDNMINWANVLDITAPLLQIQSNQVSVEEEAASAYDTERLIAELSPRQRKIFEALRNGDTSVEIEIEQGYNTNNAVRWHKHQIKKKYESIKADKYEIKFEFVCRDCGNIFNGEEIESNCTQCDSKNTLFLKSYTKPII